MSKQKVCEKNLEIIKKKIFFIRIERKNMFCRKKFFFVFGGLTCETSEHTKTSDATIWKSNAPDLFFLLYFHLERENIDLYKPSYVET